MIQNTDNKSLSELFSGDNRVTYHIPKYQREYVWGKWNWEALFDDIEESQGGHFLGSIICINTQKDSHKSADLELVDGQQRMTTITLFYLAIYEYLKSNLPQSDDEDQLMEEKLKLRSLQKKLVLDGAVRLEPSYSNHNLDDYKWIFSSVIKEVKTSTIKPKFLGLRQISRAFNFLSSRLNEVDDSGHPIHSYDSVQDLLTKLNSATLVKIDVASHADAFTLFETLNNRGVALSAIDLIKNKLLGHLERVDANSNLSDNFDRWNQIITNLTDEYKVQERFLRQFYNAFRLEKSIAVAKAPKALRSNLIRIYEELIERDVDLIFNRLEEASVTYSNNISYDSDDNSTDYIRSLRSLENVNGADGYMLLLFVSKKFNINESDKIELIDFLCKYFLRRNVTDSPPTRHLTNNFMDVIAEANKLSEYSFDSLKAIILDKGKPASDAVFREKLNGDLYEENVGATRYILSSIETTLTETKEKYVNFYTRDKNKFIWTVEHILPQGENIPEHWVTMVADGDKYKAREVRENWVHKLGNLTLTGYNSQLSNMSLDKKQNRKSSDGKFIGFKNGLTINESIHDTPSWRAENIKDRTDLLVEKTIEIFQL
jgi:uncharacterized protein with ParB-like and HNH nuclease domain|tara:strand:+ start:63 stop:1865 length:1803 start_codon:yes stop_codon:yes gene_type:complete